MENHEDILDPAATLSKNDIDSQCAVNSLILDYYRKFGKKRDLEQFFSLSTAQSDIRDTNGSFWRKMKSENDSSDSGEQRSNSHALELCRISIKCSLPEPSSSQSDDMKTKTESPHTASPPIIIEELPGDILHHTDDESLKSDDDHSQKSFDPLLDLSGHKPFSPTSSITSQRKLEWDSLADVGYAYEGEHKTSGSSLSTLEKLALKQQYSNNDSKQDIGPPTSHSTPLDENGNKSKTKKSSAKKIIKVSKKDVDFVELNVPHSSATSPPQSIQVNLTKHISFNVEKDGGVTFDNMTRNVYTSPEKRIIATTETSPLPIDKEIQTSLPKTTDRSVGSIEVNKPIYLNSQKIPVMISLNTLKKRLRKKKSIAARRKLRAKKMNRHTEKMPREKNEQLSEAESFEYMPGHIYNQNQLNINEINYPRANHNTTTGNKSSLESSGGLTSDSSKGSKHSLTKDLEKCIEVLKLALQNRYDDTETKKKLIKEIVQRLLNSKYRDDDTTTDFLSGLSFNSKKLDLKSNNTTTSTSDVNNTDDNIGKKPKKSILRMDKFDSKIVASTSQSAPNLLIATSAEKTSNSLPKRLISNTESDESTRSKTSSDNILPKTSSEEFYMKYLEALRREEAYKRHLKDKQMFLKPKLGSSETGLRQSLCQEPKTSNRLKDLMNDLTRNNYDDGSGDATRAGSNSDRNIENRCEFGRSQRSHSVFTLSSNNSESQKKQSLKKNMQVDRDVEGGTSKSHYCCCPHHSINSKVGYCDSSVQMDVNYQYEGEINEKLKHNIKLNKCPHCQNHIPETLPQNVMTTTKIKCQECHSYESPSQNDKTNVMNCSKRYKVSRLMCENHDREMCDSSGVIRDSHRVVLDNATKEINYVCSCKNRTVSSSKGDFLICKCCKLANCGIELNHPSNITKADVSCVGSHNSSEINGMQQIRNNTAISTDINILNTKRCSKSSQTNLLKKMFKKDNENSSESEPINLDASSTRCVIGSEVGKEKLIIHEATRCLQTEISIDPKISDPSLSDITIVFNCAELIGEQSREVIMDTVDDIKTFSDVYTSSDSGKLLLRSEDSFFRNEIKDSDINIIKSKNSNDIQSRVSPKDYTIPIKGTNMTLMVNLAPSETENSRKQINQSVGTEKVLIKEKGTSIEYGKSIKCQYNTAKNSPQGETISSKNSSRTDKTSPRRSNLTQIRSPQPNTYPKVVQMKEKSPLRRANTDIDKLKACYAQTDFAKETVPTMAVKDLESELIDYSSNIKVPSMDRIILRSGITNEGCLRDTKEIGIQKDFSDDETIIKKLIPDMLSKSVGSDIKISEIGLGVSCQTDLEEKNQDNILGMTTLGVQDNDAQKMKHETQSISKLNEDNNKKHTLQENTLEKNIKVRQIHSESEVDSNDHKDPLITVIQDITRRYSKGDVTKKKKKRFNEIVTILNYLLETEDSIDQEPKITPESSDNSCQKILEAKTLSSNDVNDNKQQLNTFKCCDTKSLKSESVHRDKINKKSLRDSESESLPSKHDKSVQLSSKSTSKSTESSNVPCSTDRPSTSESTACKILSKIKKECEKYHIRKKCGRKCEISSSTSVNCDDCKKVHHCSCRHKCKRSKIADKMQKKCFAYNLILQTSESMLSEETACAKTRPLPNVVVKVPKRKDKFRTETCKETIYRIEKDLKSKCSPRGQRSRSCPKDSEMSSIDDDFTRRTQQCTVREYLERNRPDFVEKSGERQNCLKFINEMRRQESFSPRLRMVIVHQPTCMGSLENNFRCEGVMCQSCDSTHICNQNPSNTSSCYANPCYLNPCNSCDPRKLQTINEVTKIASERAAHRNLLSLHVDREPDLTTLTTEQLHDLAKQIGLDMRRKKTPLKFMNEREMKKHSRNIYKTLPEVIQKKEDKKKENIKKTNLLMANIFKKNLQKKTLRGAVNLSNYSTVIKI